MTDCRYFIRFTNRITHFLIFHSDGTYKAMGIDQEDDYPWVFGDERPGKALQYCVDNYLYKELNEEDFNKLLITRKYKGP